MRDEWVFETLRRRGSFSSAARELNVARSTLLRRLAALETRLGVKLFQRFGKRLVLTEAGRQYADGLGPILGALSRLEQEVRELGHEKKGTLRIRIPRLAMGEQLAYALGAFMREAPQVVPRVRMGRVLDGEEFDVAIQLGLQDNPSLRARVLFRSPIILVASPAYLERAGIPQSPQELPDHCGVHVVGEVGESMPWPEYDGQMIPSPRAAAVVDSQAMAVQLTEEGAGITRASLPYVLERLHHGRLVQVLPEVEDHVPVSLVYAPNPSRTTRFFVDFMVDWTARHLPLSSPEV